MFAGICGQCVYLIGGNANECVFLAGFMQISGVSPCTPDSYSFIWSRSFTVSYKVLHQSGACLMTVPWANYPYS